MNDNIRLAEICRELHLDPGGLILREHLSLFTVRDQTSWSIPWGMACLAAGKMLSLAVAKSELLSAIHRGEREFEFVLLS
jgi:hypothetical protein